MFPQLPIKATWTAREDQIANGVANPVGEKNPEVGPETMAMPSLVGSRTDVPLSVSRPLPWLIAPTLGPKISSSPPILSRPWICPSRTRGTWWRYFGLQSGSRPWYPSSMTRESPWTSIPPVEFLFWPDLTIFRFRALWRSKPFMRQMSPRSRLLTYGDGCGLEARLRQCISWTSSRAREVVSTPKQWPHTPRSIDKPDIGAHIGLALWYRALTS